MSIITAFIAGLLSFLSPCVLPLLSTYLVFISGNHAGEALVRRRTLIVDTLFFILGFTLVFVAISLLLYGFIIVIGGFTKTLGIIAGSIVCILGVNFLFNFIPFLKYSREETCDTCTPKHSILASTDASILHPAKRPKGILGPFLVGIAFGAGWTPCVGTFLGSILLLAGQSGTMALSALYLAVYSAGLGLPFLLAAFFWGKLLGGIARIKRAMTAIRIISGIFLIAVGLLMIFGRFFYLNAFFQKTGYALSQWTQDKPFVVRWLGNLIARWFEFSGL
ncbi:cytochrome C biogenesis protein CcdA [Spirochaetia bacterium]|nr:cytochrome C biogenesis protein CcdA [Spirochaetia bacterium]